MSKRRQQQQKQGLDYNIPIYPDKPTTHYLCILCAANVAMNETYEHIHEQIKLASSTEYQTKNVERRRQHLKNCHTEVLGSQGEKSDFYISNYDANKCFRRVTLLSELQTEEEIQSFIQIRSFATRILLTHVFDAQK